MQTIKIILGSIAVVLSIIAYVPYIIDTLKGKTIPHVLSWANSALVAFAVFGLQLLKGGGAGAWVTLVMAVISLVITMLGCKHGKKHIKKVDIILFGLALVGVVVWLFIQEPAVATYILVAVTTIGFVPTIRKSFTHPKTETLSTYAINSIRHSLSLLALQAYSVVTVLYPAVWIAINVITSVIIIMKRKEGK